MQTNELDRVASRRPGAASRLRQRLGIGTAVSDCETTAARLSRFEALQLVARSQAVNSRFGSGPGAKTLGSLALASLLFGPAAPAFAVGILTFIDQTAPNLVGDSNVAATGEGPDITDDLSLDFVVFGNGYDPSTMSIVSGSLTDTVTIRNELSAAANKILPTPGGFSTVGLARIPPPVSPLNSRPHPLLWGRLGLCSYIQTRHSLGFSLFGRDESRLDPSPDWPQSHSAGWIRVLVSRGPHSRTFQNYAFSKAHYADDE